MSTWIFNRDLTHPVFRLADDNQIENNLRSWTWKRYFCQMTSNNITNKLDISLQDNFKVKLFRCRTNIFIFRFVGTFWILIRTWTSDFKNDQFIISKIRFRMSNWKGLSNVQGWSPQWEQFCCNCNQKLKDSLPVMKFHLTPQWQRFFPFHTSLLHSFTALKW